MSTAPTTVAAPSDALSRVCAAIPVFDHAATVGDVIRGAARHVAAVIVIDDGSRDGSGDAARAVAAEIGRGGSVTVEVLVHDTNRGKGVALRTGLARAAELGFSHVVTLDADGQHRPDDIPRLLAAAEAHPRAVVVGARDLGGERVPRGSRVGRWVSNFWVLRLTGADLPDTQSGFRVYPVCPVLALSLRCRSYDWEVEVLVRAGWAGLELLSVPIRVYYPERDARVSHFRGFVDNRRISLTYTRLALARLIPSRADWRAARRRDRPRVRLRDGLSVLRDLSGRGMRPAELALAVAGGCFIGASPLWGLHAVLSIYVSLRWHLNAVAAFLGSHISLPFFAPYLVFASVQCGHRVLRGEFLDLTPAAFEPGEFPQYVLDYLVGSLPVAVVAAAVAGLLTLVVASGLRRRAKT